MPDQNLKSWWGRDFRVVTEGLAETDVVVFVERLMSEHRESLDKLEHVDTLHRLAAKTIEDARKVAAGIKREARQEAEAEGGEILVAARAHAQKILDAADVEAAERIAALDGGPDDAEVEWRRQLHLRLSRIDSAFRGLEAAAAKALSGKISPRYLDKYLRQSVNLFSEFERLEAAVAEGRTFQPRDSRDRRA